eukprot:TRINITY_DN4831_c0_g1_i1.p1 TRINITY_DN4831_c0_g1~~TRINITY_DN4831_c0_g1_i1.p1  ORF type:complete len:347 (-),score=56.45 TRINITY_DN4831_c0_g1_i1:25-1065(-)
MAETALPMTDFEKRNSNRNIELDTLSKRFSNPDGNAAGRDLEALLLQLQDVARRLPAASHTPQKMFKTPKETYAAVKLVSEKKSQIPLDKLVVLGFLAGVYIAFGGLFAVTVAFGSPGLAAENPGLQKLLIGVTFPLALFAIIFLGGELFTGNVMYAFAGGLGGSISPFKSFLICTVAFFSNLAGCIAGAYFFGYLTHSFEADPWLSAVKSIAVKKVSYGFGVIFLRGIAANWLVNIAVYVVISAEDVSGKILGLFYPICAFAAAGFEHCVANMFYVPLGMFYGADVSVGDFIVKCLIPSTLGNIVGGGIFVGVAAWYAFGWRDEVKFKDDKEVPAYRRFLHFSFF